MMLHRLTSKYRGLWDSLRYNLIKMAQSKVTLIRPVKLLHNITFFNHWLYRRGVLEFVLIFPGTLEERGMLAWQAELGVTEEDNDTQEETDKDQKRNKELLRTIYTVPFSRTLSKKLPFLRFLPFYPK